MYMRISLRAEITSRSISYPKRFHFPLLSNELTHKSHLSSECFVWKIKKKDFQIIY